MHAHHQSNRRPGIARPLLWSLGLIAAAVTDLSGQTLHWYGADSLLGGDNTWDTASAHWIDDDGWRRRWSNSNDSTAVFAGTVGAPFTVTLASNTTIDVNTLRFAADYTIAAGWYGSRLNLVGNTPSISVAEGITATTRVALTGERVTLTGGGTWQLGDSHRLGDGLGLTITESSTFALGSNSDTVGAVILEAGRITGSGTLTTSAGFTLLSGTVDARLGGKDQTLYKTGDGTVRLNGANSYTGETAVLGGTLQLGGSHRIANASALRVDGGSFSIGAFDETLGAVTLVSGRIDGTTGTLTGSSYDLRSGFVTARLGGRAALTKTTDGLVELTGANHYTGATNILGGDLRLTGSLARTTVTVQSGGTFSGSGTASKSRINVYGTIAPGTGGIGELTTGAEYWYGGGSYEWQISDALGVAGTDWDLLSLKGGLAINATASSPFTLEVIGLDSAGSVGPLAHFDNTRSYSWSLLQASSLSGFAANKFNIDASAFASSNPLGGGAFSLTQTGNSLDLVFTPVPEPRVFAAALGILTLGFVGLQRLRHRVVA